VVVGGPIETPDHLIVSFLSTWHEISANNE
jgi:hypothetical protein